MHLRSERDYYILPRPCRQPFATTQTTLAYTKQLPPQQVKFSTLNNQCCQEVTSVSFINGDFNCPNIPEFRVNKAKNMIEKY